MKTVDYFKINFKNLSKRKIRSWLTVIGVVIGITAIVALVSIAVGMQEYVKSQFEQLGADKIIIMPTAGFGPGVSGSNPFTDREIRIIKNVRGIDVVLEGIFQSAVVKYKDQKIATTVTGMVPSVGKETFADISGFQLESGRWLRDTDRYKIVIGNLIAHKTFKKGTEFRELKPGDKLEIKNKEFKIVGVLKEIGNRQDDTSIMMTLDIAEEIFDMKDKYNYVFAEVKEGQDVNKVAENIRKELKKERGEENFIVLTTEQLAETVSSILSVISLVLVGIGGISLLVGGVGIMNTMYMAVLERTRVIGIYKALGAENRTILILFLIESGLIGLIGGLIGSVIGFGIAKAIEIFGSNVLTFPLKAWISWELFAFAVGFSFTFGLISGFLPARSAAKLNPVDALRYE